MSNIQKRINQLKPYVIGIRFLQNGVSVIDTILKEGWKVPTSSAIGISKSDEEPLYHMFYSEDENIGIDSILDFIGETITINIEREKKYELLKVKVKELEKVFRDNSLTKLQNMRFVLGESQIIPDKLGEDTFLSDISMTSLYDEPIRETLPARETLDEPIFISEAADEREQEAFSRRVSMHQDIELPPKGGKIEVEEFAIPISDGPCTHPADQFCDKCMVGY